MGDKHIPAPRVVTKIRIRGFTLKVIAYRRITPQEARLAVALYKRQYHLKAIPASGSGEILTLFGYNPADDL